MKVTYTRRLGKGTPINMEKNTNIYRKGPLPGGDRRGTSIAGGGRGRMLASDSLGTGCEGVGDRRVCRSLDATADEPTDDTLRRRETSPASSAGASVLTTQSNEDSRKKWSQAELEELMLCYYLAKAGGAGYIKRLHKLFRDRNPENPKVRKFTGNTLSNQVRSILSRRSISTELLDQIKKRAELIHNNSGTQLAEVPETLATDFNTQDTQDTIPTLESPILQHTVETQSHIELPEQYSQHSYDTQTLTITENPPIEEIDVNENQDTLILEFLQVLSETKETPIEIRKFLPKPNMTKTFIQNLHTINKYLPNLLNTNESLREINDIIYAAAKTLIQSNNQKPFTPSTTQKPKSDPPWKKRLKQKIESIRKELGRLVEIKAGANSRRMTNIKRALSEKYKITNDEELNSTIEILKQKVKAMAGRLRRYDEINERKIQNKMFAENQHKFYRSLNTTQQNTVQIPPKDDIQNFWTEILSKPINYNTDATWIEEIETKAEDIEQHQFETIDEEKVKEAIRKTQNWKTPGIDKIQNYYLKYLTSTHKYIAKLFDRMMKGREPIERWFTTGQVILIPKNQNTQDPKNWRPIACLPTMYKILTSVIANELYIHCDKNDILAPEQRGCRRRVRGCKDHLMINKAILEDAHKCQKNLSMAWVDYRKAFDSMSHEWLLKVLDIYKCPPVIKGFLEIVMPTWNVVMTARGTNTSVTTDPIYIRRGIFQGDSLSPLLFCLGINPISQILNKYEFKGYKLKDDSILNHLLYMDDLKLYANNKTNLKVLIDTVEIFTNDIGMEFGLDKCNVLHLGNGRRQEHRGEGHVLLSGEEFRHLQIDEKYKYLGVNEGGKIDHAEVRQQIQKEYFRRVKNLASSHLSARNLMKAINIYAVPVLLYTFGIINYKNADLKSIDVKTRKILAMNKAQQQKADTERLYLPINEGGRGLTSLETLHKIQIIKYKTYLETEKDYILRAIVEHDRKKDKYSIIKDTRTNLEEIGLRRNEKYTDAEIKKAAAKTKIDKVKAKPLHGQFYKAVLDKDNIDRIQSFTWLKKQLVSPSIESAIFAIQDQAVLTKQHERDILHRDTDGKCRLCLTKDETAQHIISGCEKLAGTYYTKRHNNIVQYVYWTLAKKHNFPVSNLWWEEHLTQPMVRENDSAKLMWEIPVQTDVTIVHNRPDLIYINKTENKIYLIDITVPSDYNIGAKEIEKLSKYHALRREVTRLWKAPAEVIPIVVGATGVVAKSLRRYCDKLDSHINTHIIQKQAALHTVTILSKVLGGSVFVRGETEPPLP